MPGCLWPTVSPDSPRPYFQTLFQHELISTLEHFILKYETVSGIICRSSFKYHV